MTIKNGGYQRKPWDVHGRRQVRMQRHLCHACGGSYTEQWPDLIPRSWYTRAVHRKVMDLHVHVGSSLRKAIEHVRSEIGKQERWLQWHPLAEEPREEDRCGLSVWTGERWLAQAGVVAAKSVPGQMEGIASSGEMATDGLWARLRDGTKRVVLMVADGVSGVVYPPVVVQDEESATGWGVLFARIEAAGAEPEGDQWSGERWCTRAGELPTAKADVGSSAALCVACVA